MDQTVNLDEAGWRRTQEALKLPAVCLSSLVLGLNDVSSSLIGPTSAETYLSPFIRSNIESLADGSFTRPFTRILTDAAPFVVGAILAAAFLDPMARKVQMLEYFGPYYVLFMSNYLISHIHIFLFVVGYIWKTEPVPLTVIAHFLLGAYHCLSLTTVIILCGRSATKLGAAFGMAALGVLLRTAAAAIFTGSETERKHQQHGVVWAVAMLTVTLLCAFDKPKNKPKAENPDEESATEKPYQALVTCLQQEKTPLLPRATTTTPCRVDYPPPASRTTILGALFSFLHHALITLIPTSLAHLTSPPPPSATNPAPQCQFSSFPSASSLITPTFFFWTSLAITRLTFSSWGEDIPRAKLKRLVSWALIATAVVLLLPGLYSSVGSVDALVAAACAGVALGSVYPWVVAVVHRGMGERERLGGIGVVVAFGSAGAVAGLVGSQMVTRFSEGSGVLHFVVVGGLVGGMLLCWRGLVDEPGSVEDEEVG
jgi:hypothetical protein